MTRTTTPSRSSTQPSLNPFNRKPVNQRDYGAARLKHRAHHHNNMAISSPNKKAQQNKEFKINPEIDAKLNAFMKQEPGLVEFVKNLPREQLERKFILRKMQDQEQRQTYAARVKEWLQKPEQADLRKSIMSTISPNMKPETQERAMVNQAMNYIRNQKIKIG